MVPLTLLHIGLLQHTRTHVDSQGSVGRDESVKGAKIDAMETIRGDEEALSVGLDDQAVNAAKVELMGS